jgi:hypothetical protein
MDWDHHSCIESSVRPFESGSKRTFDRVEAADRIARAVYSLEDGSSRGNRTMIPPGALGLLEAMADGPIADLEPTFENRSGRISYPAAEEYFADSEDVVRIFESLADRGVLEREFREKVYRCPDCDSMELRYVAVCPSCVSPETVSETVVRHTTCGCAAPREDFAAGGTCPECTESFERHGDEYASIGERYRCTGCGWRFAEPDGRLQCRQCSKTVGPTRAPETVVYRYRFAEDRREWLYAQLAARGAVGDVLGGRGFEIARDETVTGASGVTYLLDLYATDDERGLAVIASVAESPSTT